MRWKLLRRRLSVAAPRVIVRSHLPWPLRWAVAAAMLGFSAAIALWAFETGRELAGLDRDAKDELARLRAEVGTLRTQRDAAQAVANAADSLLKAERATQERLASQLRQLEGRNQVLQDDLGFFEKLLPVSGSGLQVRALNADAPLPGQLRYQLLVMHSGPPGSVFSGRYEVVLAGLRAGEPWKMALPGGPQPLHARPYARVEGLIDHPPEVVLQTVQATVRDERGQSLATKTLKLPLPR